MSDQLDKATFPPMNTAENENNTVEAQKGLTSFFYSNDQQKCACAVGLSPIENEQNSSEFSDDSNSSVPSPDQFGTQKFKKLFGELSILKGMVRVVDLKIENVEIYQKAQLKVEQIEVALNSFGAKLTEIEAKDQKMNEKFAEMQKEMEKLKREIGNLYKNGASSSANLLESNVGNERRQHQQEQYVSLQIDGNTENDEQPLLNEETHFNEAMDKMKKQICCLKAFNVGLLILAILMCAFLLIWFIFKCRWMHFC